MVTPAAALTRAGTFAGNLALYAPIEIANTALRIGRSTLLGGDLYEGVPGTGVGDGLLALVGAGFDSVVNAGEEMFLAPPLHDVATIAEEIRDAALYMNGQGWLTNPERSHRQPPVPDVSIEKLGWLARGVLPLGADVKRITFQSAYKPLPQGAERRYEGNETVHATVLQHADRNKSSWFIGINGLGADGVWTNTVTFDPASIYKMGFNVVMIHKPRHGKRREPGTINGYNSLSPPLNFIDTISQTVSDARSVVSWLRHKQGATRIGVYGISLGGVAVSLLIGLEKLDLAILGVPAVSLAKRLIQHGSRVWDPKTMEAVEQIQRVVDPTLLRQQTPPQNIVVSAGKGDRLAPPDAAAELFRHFEVPEDQQRFYPFGHFGFALDPKFRRLIRTACLKRLKSTPPRSKTSQEPTTSLWKTRLAATGARRTA